MESIIREMWDELRQFINVVDRNDAAEIMVSILVDNDYDAEQIKTMFKGDSDIKSALSAYTSNHVEEEYEEEDPEDELDEDWN